MKPCVPFPAPKMPMTDLPRPAQPRRIIVAITGASGAVYGARLVEMLDDLPDVETHLIITAGARRTLAYETAIDPDSLASSATVTYREDDLAAAISSGSFRTEGMIVAPCSIKTLSGIAHCYDDNLVVRAADVVLKERRLLALLVRETPLHGLHLRLMSEVTSAGAIVVPPVPAFYHHPKTIDDIVNQTVGRTLDLFGFDTGVVERWEGSKWAARRAQESRRSREGN